MTAGLLALRSSIPLVDRYICRLTLRPLLLAIATIVFILSLETLPRLLEKLNGVVNRTELVFLSLMSLAPEYIGIALPIALFLATALAFRQLALNGELDALAASGMSDLRLLRVPLWAGVASCVMLIGLMGYLQPAGERRLDRIGQSVSRGDFGFALMAGLGNRLAADTQLYFSRVSGSSDLLQDIVIEKGPVRMTARTAIVVPSQNDQILLALKDGFVTWQRAGDTHGVGFDTFKVTLPVAGPGRTRPKPPRDRLQRFNLDQLVPFRARDANDLTPIMARASASTRIAAAAFCVILPLFGFTFGIPPKRSRSAIGLGIGLLAIILFWRISALIEDDLAAVAPWAHGLLLSLLAALAIQLIRIQRRHGFGSIEQALLRMFTAVRRHLALVRPMRA